MALAGAYLIHPPLLLLALAVQLDDVLLWAYYLSFGLVPLVLSGAGAAAGFALALVLQPTKANVGSGGATESSETAGTGAATATLSSAPPLGIVHGLVAIAGVAVYLTVWKGILAAVNLESVQQPASAGLLLMARAVVGGTALAGLALGITWRTRGRPFPSYPGEWFLCAFALRRIPLLLMPLVAHWTLGEPLTFLVVVGSAWFLLVAGCYVDVPRWRWWLVACGGWFILPPLIRSAQATAVMSGVGVLLLVIGGLFLARDLSQGERRLWTHWLGLGLGLADIVLLLFGRWMSSFLT